MIYYISMLSTTGGKLKVSPKDTWGIFKNKKTKQIKKCCDWIWDNRKNHRIIKKS